MSAENDARRERIDQRDEFSAELRRLWDGPGVIRYDEQDHERMAWIVFDLIEAAKAEALREAADWIEATDSQKGIASRALSPGKAFAVAALRDRAARVLPPADGDAEQPPDHASPEFWRATEGYVNPPGQETRP